jgi:predicted Zn-dependent protease
MKNFISSLLLLIVIGVSFLFSAAKFMSIGPSTNYFNSHYRAEVDKYPKLRQILSLHNDGDGKSDFLGFKTKKIVVEVIAMKGLNTNSQVYYDLGKKIQEVTGKETLVVFEPDVAYQKTVNTQELDTIVAANKKYQTTTDQAVLNLLIVSAQEGDQKVIGLTYQEFGAIAYINAVQDFIPKNKKIMNLYIFSTLLHEFGHQLGLAHNDKPKCLMNPEAEISKNVGYDLKNVVLDFCAYEKGLIKANAN